MAEGEKPIERIQALNDRAMLAESRIGYGKYGPPVKQATDAVDLSYLAGFRFALSLVERMIGAGSAFKETEMTLPSGEKVQLDDTKGRKRFEDKLADSAGRW